MSGRIVYETHSHTPLCHHAEGEPIEYARVADARGLAGIVLTCHNPMPDDFGHTGRMTFDELPTYLAMVDQARRAYAGRVDVRVGLECDYFPGYERIVEKTLEVTEFHHVLGSVHPQLMIWRRHFAGYGPLVAQKNYFAQLADSAETGLFDTIAHPDLIKNMTPDDWDLQRIMDHIQAALDRIAATGVAMELNTSGLQKTISEMNPAPAILHEMCARGIPVTVGADAHVPRRVAADYTTAYDLLEAAGYTRVSYFIDRRRVDIDIDAARQSLAPRPEPVASATGA